MRILVVDDNEDLVNLLADVIGDEGYSVRTGTSGAQAIGLVDEFIRMWFCSTSQCLVSMAIRCAGRCVLTAHNMQ